MQQLNFNQYEKIVSNDYNNLQFALAQMFQDQMMYPLFGSSGGGVIGTGFLCSYTSALVASLAAGTGFFYDSSQTGFNPKNRMIIGASAITVNLTANTDPTNNRIDLVCLAPNFAVTANANRYVKTGGTGPVTLTSVPKTSADSYTLQVVAGTPSGSPAVPATPAGYIAIAQIVNRAASAGMVSGAAITDVRNVLQVTPAPAPAQITGNTALSAGVKVYLMNPTGGTFTATLPSAAANPKADFSLKNNGYGSGNVVNIATTGGDTVEDDASDSVAAGEFRRYVSDGVSNWVLCNP